MHTHMHNMHMHVCMHMCVHMCMYGPAERFRTSHTMVGPTRRELAYKADDHERARDESSRARR